MKEDRSLKETVKKAIGKVSLRSRVEICVLLGYVMLLLTYVAICGGFT